MVEEVVLLFWT